MIYAVLNDAGLVTNLIVWDGVQSIKNIGRNYVLVNGEINIGDKITPSGIKKPDIDEK